MLASQITVRASFSLNSNCDEAKSEKISVNYITHFPDISCLKSKIDRAVQFNLKFNFMHHVVCTTDM